MQGLSGIPPEQALGEYVWDVRYRCLPEERKTQAHYDWLKQGLAQLFETGHWQVLEEPLRVPIAHTNGHEYVAELIVASQETRQGYRILGTCLSPDLSSRPARDTQQAYQSLIDHSLQGVVIFQGWRLVYANDAAAAITGYAQHELLSFRLRDLIGLIHPTTQPLAWKDLREWLSGRKAPLFEEYLYRHPDGRDRWIEVHTTLISRQGKPALQAAFLDSTDRKAAQDALRDALEQERRTHELMLSLSRAAQAVLRARTDQDIYRVIGEQVVELGYNTLVMTLDPEGQHATLAFVTYPPELIQGAERITNVPMLGYRFRLPEDGYYDRIVSDRQAVYNSNAEQAITEAMGPSAHRHVPALTGLLGNDQRISAPLVVRGRVHGILIVNGSGLREEDVPAVEAFANQAAIALENALLSAEEERQREALRALSARLVRIQESEQSRIARELHDETGQTLTAMSLHLARAIQDLTPPAAETRPKTLEHLEQARALVKQTTRQIREMCFQLRPGILDEMGLVPALRWLTNWIAQQFEVQVEFKGHHVDGRFPTEVETTLYRVAQEGLTNAMRHSRAQNVSVHLERLPASVRLTVADNGAGFKPDPSMLVESTGLVGMRERVKLVGGTFEIESQPGEGTRLSANIPL
jgi:PAS domain S-box-containing protein